MKILIVEDEVKTGDYIRQGLMESGFVVDLARTGLDGHHLALTGSYDLIVLDVMLPDVDGWRIMQSLREARIHHACVISHRKGRCRRPGQGSGIGSGRLSGQAFCFFGAAGTSTYIVTARCCAGFSGSTPGG